MATQKQKQAMKEARVTAWYTNRDPALVKREEDFLESLTPDEMEKVDKMTSKIVDELITDAYPNVSDLDVLKFTEMALKQIMESWRKNMH
jgi:hypothetical protein